MEFDAQETRYAEPEGSAPPGALVRPRPSRAPPAPQEEAHEESPMDEGDGAIPEEEDEWAEEDSMASSGSGPPEDGPMDEGDGFAGPPQDWECGDIYYYGYQYEALKRQAGGGRDPQLEQEEMREQAFEGIRAARESTERLESWAASLDEAAVSELPPGDATLYRRVMAGMQAGAASAGASSAATAPVDVLRDEPALLMHGAASRAPVTPPVSGSPSAAPSADHQEWHAYAPWRSDKKRAQHDSPEDHYLPRTKAKTPEPPDRFGAPDQRKTLQDTPEEDYDFPRTKAQTPEPPHRLGAPGQGPSPLPSAQVRPPPSSSSSARPATAPSIAPKARPVSRPPVAASHRGPGVMVPVHWTELQPPPAPAPPWHARPPPPPPPPPEARASSLPRHWVNHAEFERHRHVQAERGRIIGARQRSTTVSAKAGQLLEEEDAGRAQLVPLAGQLLETAQHLLAATAHEPIPAFALGKDFRRYKRIAQLSPEEAAALPPKPTRMVPLVLSSPHEASQSLHKDWTLVHNSWKDPKAREREYRLRDDRNHMIWEKLEQGGPAFYPSSGNSMWPMVQSNDHCLFHPIQVVRMGPKSPHIIDKEESTIQVGDVVFCRVRPTSQFYAHFVHYIDWDTTEQERRYYIGGLKVQGNDRPYNGHCYRCDIFGILINVYVNKNGSYHKRPLPRTLFHKVCPLVLKDKWSWEAESMCEAEKDPDMTPPVQIDPSDFDTKAAMTKLLKVW